jgi:hypothetical protein
MVGDFNNDGFIDFATGDYNSGTVSILINNGKRRSRPLECEEKESEDGERRCRPSDLF